MCGACDGVLTATPREVINRSGLSVLSYRVGEYSHWHASLIAGLSQQRFAPMTALLTRDRSDFTLGLVDAFACSADVLSFYQERIAVESWLRTATERVSLQEMGRLIAYRLRPGVAAEAWLAFATETPPTPPASIKPEPGSFVTGVPDTVVLDKGLKVSSVPGPGEVPQSFETAEALQARWPWNAMRALADESRPPGFGAREAWLAGTATQLKVGDMLVFAGPQFEADSQSNRWDRRLLTAVQPDAAAGRTRVAWAEPLGSVTPLVRPADPPTVLAMRERAAIFGHNAPDWASLGVEFQRVYAAKHGQPVNNEWPGFDIFASGGQRVSLDREYAGVVAGSLVLLDKPSYSELYKVTAAVQGSRAEFALSGKSTALALSGQNLALFSNDVRQTTVFARSEALALARAPVLTPVSGDSLQVAADVAGLAGLAGPAGAGGIAGAAGVAGSGRRLIVQGPRVSDGRLLVHLATLVSATPAASAADGGTLQFTPPLPEPLRRDATVVYGNVALATHGETVAQVLGAGNAGTAFQAFELKQAPLTHRAAATESGAASELTVRVGDVAWAQRESLYGAAATAAAYTLRSDEQGRVWVQFGDGRNGARPASGVNNIRASYRKGLGAAGNVRAESLTQPAIRPLGLKSVANPAPALGGTDAEAASSARRSMPLVTRTLGRAVSVLDYEDFARAYAGVAKAQARVLSLTGGPTVCITVAGADGAVLSPANPVWANLLAALRASGDPHVAVRLLGHRASTFKLGLKLKVGAAHDTQAVLDAVQAALRERYAFSARELGQPVQQSDVMACVHTVAGVVALDLDLLYGGSAPPSQTVPSRQPRLLAQRMAVLAGQPQASEMLTLDPQPLDRLEVMS